MVNLVTVKIVKFDQEARMDKSILPETMVKEMIISEKVEKVDGMLVLLFTYLAPHRVNLRILTLLIIMKYTNYSISAEP